jgi:chromosomal replication initiator protein
LELPAQLEMTPAWREIRAELRRVVGDSTYDLWLAPLKVRTWDGAVLILEAPPATRAWVAKRFGRILERSARSVVGANVTVALTHDGGGERDTSVHPSAHTRAPSVTSAPPGAPADGLPGRELPINPRLSFSQFVIGDGNRLAHAAALSVAELPGQAFNPLFLHAPPGLGKTHLLHSIGNYVLAYGGGTTVRYTTVEAFTNHFISAINTKTLAAFKSMYRDADVLLIDDVQFLASKAKTEEEFFHTFNALYETGRQLVLTCDRLPRQLRTIEERLRERFESGLVADLQPPDFATRVAILRKRVALDRIELADNAVLELIAERVTDNIRTLEGALIRIVALHSLRGQPIDLALAAAVLDEIHPAAAPTAGATPTVQQIQAIVARYFEITPEELISASRAARIAWPRQVAIQLTRELTPLSLQDVGTAFGGRNHATVLHACKKVAERVHTSPEAVQNLADIRAELRGGEADLPS